MFEYKPVGKLLAVRFSLAQECSEVLTVPTHGLRVGWNILPTISQQEHTACAAGGLQHAMYSGFLTYCTLKSVATLLNARLLHFNKKELGSILLSGKVVLLTGQ